ncbi:BatA domain-containing protein [candidate division KSB1 bacterium]|nr:BatA domain-containing protein [candidate division KSB1 bacterium]
MNFLNSAILVGLVAAILPLLIHLFTKSKAKPVAFSTLRFLRQLQNKKIRRLKLRQILLLILRTLIVLLLVLAFARPTCRTSSPDLSTGDANTSAAIILDNSISMARIHQGKSLFERAKVAAHAIVTNFREGDQIFFITTTDTSLQKNKIAYHDFDLLHREIDQTELNYNKTDLTAALNFTRRMLAESKNINKEIFTISDLQRNAFRQDTLRKVDPLIRSYAVAIQDDDSQNLSVESVHLRSTILQKGKLAELEVKLRNRGRYPVRNRLVEVFLNDQRVAQNIVDVEAESESRVLSKFILDRSGFLTGRVRLEDDDLLQDNERYFSFTVPEKINIVLISQTPDADFLLSALQPTKMPGSLFEIVRLQEERLSSQILDTMQVIVLNNVPQPSKQSIEKLRYFIDGGGGLLLILGAATDLQWYNEAFNSLLGLPRFVEVMGDENSRFTLDKMDLDHPVFSGIFEKDRVHFTRPFFFYGVRVGANAYINPILSFSSGEPYLFEVRKGQGTILVFTSGFDVKQSDVAFRAIFAPLMHRCAAYLGLRSQSAGDDLLIGQSWRFRLPSDAINVDLQIVRPDQEIDRVQPVVTASGAWIQYEECNDPGIYYLSANHFPIAQWAVNLDETESDFRRMDETELNTRYQIQVVQDVEDLTQMLVEQRVGKELWYYFLLAVLALLIIEMLLYREKGEAVIAEGDTES